MKKSNVNKLIFVEFTKLKNQKTTYITFVLVLIFVISSSLFRGKLGASGLLNMGSASGWQIATFAVSWTLKVTALIVLIFSAQTISDEFSDRTIKLLLTSPISRKDFLWGKFSTIAIYSTVLITFTYFAGFIMGAAGGDLSALQERGYVIVSSQKMLSAYLIAYLLNSFTFLSIGFFGALIALLINRASLTIAAGLAVYFFLNIAGQFDHFRRFLFTSYLTFPIDTAKEISYGIAASWAPDIFFCLAVTSVTIVFCLLFSWHLFHKKDILA